MNVAFAVWKGRISPVFDVCRNLLIVKIEKEKTEGRMQICLPENPACKARTLKDMEIHTLVCGAISREVKSLIDLCDIETISFVAGDVEEIIDAYIEGNLPNPRMTMPGCCQKHRCRRRGSDGKRRGENYENFT